MCSKDVEVIQQTDKKDESTKGSLPRSTAIKTIHGKFPFPAMNSSSGVKLLPYLAHYIKQHDEIWKELDEV